MENVAIAVKIYNDTYTLRSSAPEKEILQIAQEVDTRMHKLAEEKKVQNKEKLAVWTALNLAADLQELRRRYDRLLAAAREG